MNEKILVVDDAKFARTLVKRALANGGYDNIIEAANAADTKKIFAEEHPDLTILDITLPDNSDLTLLKDLLELAPQAKIIMNSAIGQTLIISDALKMGAKNFITKPFEEQELLQVVKFVWEAPAGPDVSSDERK